MEPSVRVALPFGLLTVSRFKPVERATIVRPRAATAAATHGYVSGLQLQRGWSCARSGSRAFRDLPRERPCFPPGWRAGGRDTGGSSVIDLRMSGIACQKVVKIYSKRPGLVNALSRFAACFFSRFLLLHLFSAPPSRSPPTRH